MTLRNVSIFHFCSNYIPFLSFLGQRDSTLNNITPPHKSCPQSHTYVPMHYVIKVWLGLSNIQGLKKKFDCCADCIFCKFPKHYWIAYSKWINLMLYNFYLDKAVKKWTLNSIKAALTFLYLCRSSADILSATIWRYRILFFDYHFPTKSFLSELITVPLTWLVAKPSYTDTPLVRKFHFKKLERERAYSFLFDFSYCSAAKWSQSRFLSTYWAWVSKEVIFQKEILQVTSMLYRM